jgi:hypothetical protein
VDLGTLLAPDDRVLDVGVAGPDVAEDLAARGVTRYLGLTDDDLDAVRRDAGPLAGRFHPLGMLASPTKLSADLVILRRAVAPLVWSLFSRPTVRLVAVERGGRRPGAGSEARLAARLGGRGRRVRRLGRYTCGGSTFDVYHVTLKRRRPTPRHYLSPVTGVSGFAEQLARAGVRYAVLRWFEDLPELEPGEDLDLLVADEDVEAVQEILADEPGLIPVDLYSVSGLSGSAFRNAAYFPPTLARGLLDRSVPHPSGFRVPAPLDHLHSMAYHAVYHKGASSGLDGSSTTTPEHDYPTVLRNIAEQVGAPTASSLAEMDEYLASVGWRPPEDTLRRLSPTNDWVARTFFDAGAAATSDLPELAVFLIRERALDHTSLEELTSVLDYSGFEVVVCERLSAAGAERCVDQARGGNWGRGPFPTSGGPPAAIIVAVHYRPKRPDQATLTRHPHLTNVTVHKAKDRMRRLIARRVPREERFNAVHSSDNEIDAWQYVEMGLPERVDAVRSLVTQRRQLYRELTATGQVLSRGRRSVVARHGDRVRKTFYPAFTRYADREIRAFTTLHPLIPEVPEILDHGEDWFEVPYFENSLSDRGRDELLPLGVLRQMVRVLGDIHDAGYELVDARPDNFVLDPVEGLKILDFEFIRPLSPSEARPLRESAAFVGISRGEADGDVPVGRTDYETNWHSRTGMELDVLLTGTTPAQQVSRAAYRARRAIDRRREALRRAGSGPARQLRAALGRGGRRAGDWAERRSDAVLP